MKIGNIITLDNDKKYLLLETVNLKDKDYYYALEVDRDSLKPTENYTFLEQIKNTSLVSEVTDDEVQSELFILCTNSFSLKIDEMFNE